MSISYRKWIGLFWQWWFWQCSMDREFKQWR